MKRRSWLILLVVAILIVLVGFAGHLKSLEALGFLIAVIAIAMFIWSSVHLSLEVRPPTTTTRRRFRRIQMPHIGRRVRHGSHTEELHAAIFQDQPADVE